MEFEFTPTVDSLDIVPADFRGLYAESEEGGGFALRSDDPGVKSAVSAITRFQATLKKVRGEVKGLKADRVDLSPLSDYGDSVESILEGVNNALAEAQQGNKSKGKEEIERQVSKIKADLGTAHATELESRDKRIEALTGQLHGILVTGEAKSALAEAGAVDADLILPFISKQVKVAEEDGQFVVTVVDDAGDTRYSGSTGAPMSVKELVAEMKGQEKYGPLFKSEAGGGGGTPPGGGRRAPARDADLSPTGKIASGLKKGQARRAGADS